MKEKLRAHRDTIYRFGIAMEDIGKATIGISFIDLFAAGMFPNAMGGEARFFGFGAIVGGVVGAASMALGSNITSRIETYYHWRIAQRLSGQPS